MTSALPPFNILDHVDKLKPAEGRDKKGYYHCPVCGDDNFTISKTGAYQCWGQQCKERDIRQAIAPLGDLPKLEPIKLQHAKATKVDKEIALNTAEVQAKAEELALLVAEKVYSPEQAAISMAEWCRANHKDGFSASKLLQGILKQLTPSGDCLEGVQEDAEALKELVFAYASEKRFTERFVIRERLLRKFKVKDDQLEGLLEELIPDSGLDVVRGAEATSDGMTYIQRLSMLRNGEIPPGVGTGLANLDRLLGGLGKKTLTFIGGKTSQGKTTLAQGITRHVAKSTRQPVVVFNLEMTTNQWKDRWVASELGIDCARIKSGRCSEKEFDLILDCMAHFEELPIFLSECSGVTPRFVSRTCASVKAQTQSDIALVVVDYINLMTFPGEKNRVQEVSKIARALQNIAKEIDAPFLVLTQLNRGSANRADKEPILEDIRESGEIEQVADAILFVHRPNKGKPENGPDNIGKIICAKNRHGPCGVFDTFFEGAYQRFTGFEPEDKHRTYPSDKASTTAEVEESIYEWN
ncbi:DnaB-like helicase C-terminal domain-containing protein [Leptothoe sp. ISB3NOV94-8A]